MVIWRLGEARCGVSNERWDRESSYVSYYMQATIIKQLIDYVRLWAEEPHVHALWLSTIYITKNLVLHDRTKYIEVDCNIVRDYLVKVICTVHFIVKAVGRYFE